MGVALNQVEQAAVQAECGEANGLPNRFYVSPRAASYERDTLLANTWTCVGYASDVAISSARPFKLLGLPLVMVKDAAGTVRVFHNVCRHRGHKLVNETCPIKNVLRCPYHSWAYGADGSLVATPHIGGPGVHDVPGLDRSQKGLFTVASYVWMDMVFINLSGSAASFESHIAPLEQRWARFTGDGGLAQARPAATHGRMEFMLSCNWKLAVENYCESYHLPWVHPGLNSYSRIEDHYNILAGDWGAGQGTTVFDFSNRAGISLPRFPQWPEALERTAEYIALFPNVLLGLQNDHFYSIVLTPRTAGKTHEDVQIYYVGDAADGVDYDAARHTVLEGWRDVFLEDVGVCESMQKGRASPVFDGGVFSPVLDNATHHFHRWTAARLGEV